MEERQRATFDWSVTHECASRLLHSLFYESLTLIIIEKNFTVAKVTARNEANFALQNPEAEREGGGVG